MKAVTVRMLSCCQARAGLHLCNSQPLFSCQISFQLFGNGLCKTTSAHACSVGACAGTGSSQFLLLGTYSAVALSCVSEFSPPFLQQMTWNNLHFSKLQDQESGVAAPGHADCNPSPFPSLIVLANMIYLLILCLSLGS